MLLTGLTIFFIGIVLHMFTTVGFAWAVAAAGALIVTLQRLHVRIKEQDRNLMRLQSIQLFSSVLMLVTAYFLKEAKSYWVIPCFISAVLELYASYRIK